MKIGVILTLFCACIGTAQSAERNGKTPILNLPAIDAAAEKAALDASIKGPLKYALPTVVENVQMRRGVGTIGQWTELNGARWLWTLELKAEGATSLDLGFTDFFLPPGATLSVSTPDGAVQRGPFDSSRNPKHGFFWPGTVPGDHAIVRVEVDQSHREHLRFTLAQAARGFYRFWDEPAVKSGSCNVDVVCPEGDGWTDQINAVGRYTFATPSGNFLCTGQLINNTAQDGTPYFLTADHCGYTQSNAQVPLQQRQDTAASVNVWWNYQSSVCRTPGSNSSGTTITTAGFNDTQSGASYIASNPFSDFALLQLDQVPNPNFEVTYTGWDRRVLVPENAVSIHHPSGNAKRISHENEPVTSQSYLQNTVDDGSHFRVDDWDSGTTEGGSSGAGLWNSDQLLVGQLHGGFAACGNDSADWYGQFSASWDHGDEPIGRLSDWLDPIDSGAQTLNGLGGCEQPDASILNNNSAQQIGAPQTYIAEVQGGTPPYRYEWDINDDGFNDGEDNQITVTFQKQRAGNIRLKVTDASDCVSVISQAVVIDAPEILSTDAQSHTEVCGNGDDVVDPGERWRSNLVFANIGKQTAIDAYAVFTKGNQNSLPGQSGDVFGNTANLCVNQFIDISGTGSQLPWIASSPSFPAEDDGVTSPINLPISFNLYGSSHSQLVASSNGYLSVDINANGSDYDNDCPLPVLPDQDSTAARIMPMHDDLVADRFYYQHFNNCPRPSETAGNIACDVFMWDDVSFFNSNEDFRFQAILYAATSQWVFQFDGAGFDGSGSTTGIQAGGATDALVYACNDADSLNGSTAVCLYHRDFPEVPITENFYLETPAIALGTLTPASEAVGELVYSIDPAAQCGDNLIIRHQASAFKHGFNEVDIPLIVELGQQGQCQPVNNCDVSAANQIAPASGLWWNPERSGNGVDLQFINGEFMVFLQYTALPDHTPIWYITDVENSYANDQSYNEVVRIEYAGPYAPGASSITTQVGQAHTTLIDATHAIQTRRINGAFSAELLEWFDFSSQATSNDYTGIWYAPDENGWGETVGTQGDGRVLLHYLYDNNGKPYWVLGNGANDHSPVTMRFYNTFCPHCPKQAAFSEEVGSSQMQFFNGFNGVINSLQIAVPPSLRENATWNRSNTPVSNITPQD